MFEQSLKLKVSLYLTIVLSVAMILFIMLIVQRQRANMLNEVSRHVTQVSEVITKSTRYAMLVNQPEFVDKIILDVGNQKDIEKVRVLNKEGRIIHSNNPKEVGRSIDRQAEACVVCHQAEKPLERIPDSKRWRIFETPEGRLLLGSMEVIRNEPSCSSAACHYHPESQSVLGVLDITHSLDEIKRTMLMQMIGIVVISLSFILVVSISVGALLNRLIYVRLEDLESGAKKLSSGDLDHRIPVRDNDEFGRMAGSFNLMTVALQKSRDELQEWVQTLEQKVEKRTQELRVAEAEVAHGEKLASIGVLSAGIAHELNNPLTGVLTFTSLLRKKMPEGSQDAEDLDLIIHETKRCASIIRRLLDFGREKVPEKKFANINLLIENTVCLVERPASLQQIEISMDLDSDLPPVWIDADLIKQVIMNMLINAQQAIEGKGSVTIQTRCYTGKPGGESEPMVEIEIIDTGCGIPEANLQRIFDPFFTSKEVGKGTGLGLSVSFGIIRAHGGSIKVESIVGDGTTFRIQLPIQPPFDEVVGNTSESTQ